MGQVWDYEKFKADVDNLIFQAKNQAGGNLGTAWAALDIAQRVIRAEMQIHVPKPSAGSHCGACSGEGSKCN